MTAMSMPPPPPKLKRQPGTEVPRVRFADEEPLSTENADTRDDDSIHEEPLSTDKADTRIDVFTSRRKLVDLMQKAQEKDTRFAIKSTLGTLDGWLVEKHLLTKKEDIRYDDSIREDFLFR